VVGDSESAEDAFDDGEDVVLARATTSPDDVGGMIAARAVITEQGGTTSHAAVVSRELHTPCVVGCGKGALQDLAGSEVTVDGASGKVYAGLLPLAQPLEGEDPDMAVLLDWARERCQIRVHKVGTPEAAGLPTVDHHDPATLTVSAIAGGGALAAEHPLPVLLMVLERTRQVDTGKH
jgi:pyruvate,orthophosphate dikinase